MQENYENELTPEVKDKMKKNLIYVVIFSIIMLFAGFTSAYIVSMGDSFWLKFPFPTAFYISTIVIFFSSIFYIIGLNLAKKGKFDKSKWWFLLTFFFGVGFVFFQFKAYNKLVESGFNPVNSHIMVVEGRYGQYFELKYKNDFIELDDNDYTLKGKPLNSEVRSEMQSFASQFTKIHDSTVPQLKNYGKSFTIYYKEEPVSYIQGKLRKTNGETLTMVELDRLMNFSYHVRDGRGDFFAKGKMGKDFKLYFRGEELQYENRELLYNGQELDPYLRSKALETSDQATTFLWIITALHLLHILVTLIFMLRISIRSFTGKYNLNNVIDLKVGGIFWHFLGLLWLYLLLFLLFIH